MKDAPRRVDRAVENENPSITVLKANQTLTIPGEIDQTQTMHAKEKSERKQY